MSKETIQPKPSDLRTFAFLVGGVTLFIFGLLLPYLSRRSWNPYIVFAGLFVVLWGLLLPKTLNWPYRTWMFVGEILGWINTRIILSIIFFILFTPIGLLKKLFGQDSMKRNLEPESNSYRIINPERPVNHMERPF
jgi:hypothetical protein